VVYGQLPSNTRSIGDLKPVGRFFTCCVPKVSQTWRLLENFSHNFCGGQG
jgi:hypothetical protein